MAKKNMFENFVRDKKRLETQEDHKLIEEDEARPQVEEMDISHQLPISMLPWSTSPRADYYTEQLLQAGYTSTKIIATATVPEISSMVDIPENYLQQLISRASDWAQYNFETAATLLDDRSKLAKISTGSKALDDLLGGGIEPRSITEFFGSFTTGKTQVSIQLAVNAVLAETDDTPPSAVYIDTEGSFRPERVVQICEPLEIEAETVLDRILVGRAHNTTMQMQLVNNILDIAREKTVKLVIVDSLTSNFRAEYIGQGTLIDRQQKLNQHVQQLSRISDLLNVAVVVTNQVMSVIGDFEDSVVPVGGNIIAHGSTHRVQFTKSDRHNQVRYAKLIASPSFPDGDATFRITRTGISDVSGANSSRNA